MKTKTLPQICLLLTIKFKIKKRRNLEKIEKKQREKQRVRLCKSAVLNHHHHHHMQHILYCKCMRNHKIFGHNTKMNNN